MFSLICVSTCYGQAKQMIDNDKKLLLACIGGSILTFNAIRAARSLFLARESSTGDWIPVGTVKHLWLYPIKSCHRKEVFSLFVGRLGASFGEVRDREFLVIDGETGRFHTARTVPKMLTMIPDVSDGVLTVSTPDGNSVSVNLAEAIEKKDVRRGTLHDRLQADGVDCGDEIADFFSAYTATPGMRVIMYRPDLFNGRPCVPEEDWWENPVPKRNDTVMYVDLAPFLVTTEGSLAALNDRLPNPVKSANFRGNIVVEHSGPWDEDKWADIRIGDAQLQCFKPCTRCVLTTVDPELGVKDPNMQPLRKLREFRLAPEGKLRKAHGDSPIFGVNAGMSKPGYIHVGQTVYARYKPSAF